MGFEVPHRNSRFIRETPSVQGCIWRFFVCGGGVECPDERGEEKRTDFFVFLGEMDECPRMNIHCALKLNSQAVRANNQIMKDTIHIEGEML